MLLISLPLFGAEGSSHGGMTAEDQVLMTATVKVEAIDREKRELTLRSPAGEVNTVTVD